VGLGRTVRNAASMLAGDAAGEILVVYALGLAALSLGPVGFGRLAESQAFMDPFDILGGLGLGNVAMVVAASRGGVDGGLRGTIWGMRTASAALTATLGLGVAFLTGRADAFRLLVAISVGMMIVPVSIVSVLPFRYEQSLHRRIMVPFLVSIVRLGGAFLAYRFMREPLGFQLAVLGATAAAAVLDYGWARRFYPERLHFDWSLARRLLVMGWPAAVFEVTVAIYSRASYFLLRGSGAVAQGEYAAADRLVKPLLSVATALYVSALPAIAALAAAGHLERLRVTYRRAIVRVFAFALPIAVPFWFLAAWLLRTFAPAYAGSIWPYRALLVGAFFIFLNTLSAAFILALGKFREIMVIVLIDLIVYLALALHLIPKYGSLGAALSTTTMEAINTCMQTPLVFFLLRAKSQLGGHQPSE
jgi:O-antigen/teichoic acid export membrane protein